MLQLLGVSLCGLLQWAYGKKADDYTRAGHSSIRNADFSALLHKARTATYTPEKIQGAFAECGIVPFNSRVVLNKVQGFGGETVRAA